MGHVQQGLLLEQTFMLEPRSGESCARPGDGVSVDGRESSQCKGLEVGKKPGVFQEG